MSPPGSSVLEELSQARTLEWVPFPPAGDLPDPGLNLHLLHLLHWTGGRINQGVESAVSLRAPHHI